MKHLKKLLVFLKIDMATVNWKLPNLLLSYNECFKLSRRECGRTLELRKCWKRWCMRLKNLCRGWCWGWVWALLLYVGSWLDHGSPACFFTRENDVYKWFSQHQFCPRVDKNYLKYFYTEGKMYVLMYFNSALTCFSDLGIEYVDKCSCFLAYVDSLEQHTTVVKMP